jgi:hypothetical protein
MFTTPPSRGGGCRRRGSPWCSVREIASRSSSLRSLATLRRPVVVQDGCVPLRVGERRGDDVLRQLVQPVGELTFRCGPERLHGLVGDAAEHERLAFCASSSSAGSRSCRGQGDWAGRSPGRRGGGGRARRARARTSRSRPHRRVGRTRTRRPSPAPVEGLLAVLPGEGVEHHLEGGGDHPREIARRGSSASVLPFGVGAEPVQPAQPRCAGRRRATPWHCRAGRDRAGTRARARPSP